MNRANRLPKIPHAALIRAPGLLPMLYRISEVAEELHVTTDQVRYWICKGLPEEPDAQGVTCIDGEVVQRWFDELKTKRKWHKLDDKQAYCFHCAEAVPFTPLAESRQAHQVLQTGICPTCGTTINRGVKNAKS